MTDTSTKLFSSKTLVSEGEKGAVWNVRPFQLVSLLEMLEHNANLFFLATRNLYELQMTIEHEIKERGGMSPLTDWEINYTNGVLDSIRRACHPLQLYSVFHRLSRFNNLHFQPMRAAPFNLEQLRVELDSLVEEIASALSQNKFMMIPDSKAEYYDKTELFGFEVAERFPKANKEIKEAGNCYATGNNAACVFHLMRAAEHGARVIVKALKIKVWDRKVGIKKDELPYPVALCEWGTLMRVFGEVLKNLPTRTSVKASKRTGFFNEAIAHFGLLKDAWRNPLSHTRFAPDEYDEYKTMSIMVNTRHFMQHLATRLKE